MEELVRSQNAWEPLHYRSVWRLLYSPSDCIMVPLRL